MSEDKRFYVYVHRRKTDGRIFYVGKGQGNRANDRQGRNIWWRRIVAKYDFYAEIVFWTDVEKCAFSVESGLIRYIGRENLCNLSDGGEGPSGMRHTAEWREYMSGKMSGRTLSQEHKDSLRRLRVRSPTKNFDINHVGVKVTNCIGETFQSMAEASRVVSARVGMSDRPANIKRSADSKSSKAYGFRWAYGDVPPERIEDRIVRRVRNKTTGQVYSGVRDACRSMLTISGNYKTPSPMYKVLRNGGGMCYGYEWEYVDEDT